MNDWACRACRRVYAKGQPDQICGECRRHLAYGVIVDACVGNGLALDVLDALATLMGSVTRLRRQHNRELLQESIEAQRDARSAWHDGFDMGRSAEQ